MAEQENAAQAAKQNQHDAEHERIMHARHEAGTAAAKPVLQDGGHPRSAADALKAATDAATSGADAVDAARQAAAHVEALAKGRDLGVMAAQQAARAAHHDVAQQQRERGEMTPGSRMAAERNAAADAAYKTAIDGGSSAAQAQALADAAAEAVAAQQVAAGGPLDADKGASA